MARPLSARLPAPNDQRAPVVIAAGRRALDDGRYDDAVKAFRKAVALAPSQSALHYALGMALVKAGRPAEATVPLLCARDLAPGSFDCQLGLADAYYLAHQPHAALPEYLRAGELNPAAVVVWSNAGAIFRELGRPEHALQAYHRALSIDPAYAPALCNSALAFHDLGEFAMARDSVRLALEASPGYQEALWNCALLDLMHGDFVRGWPGHEYRTVQLARLGGLRTFPEARWNGERFDGKRLLLWPEQGMGDQLQFVRFLPRVKALGGTIVLGCSAPLVQLFRANCPDADEVVVIGEPFAPVDVQLPLLSLPHVLGLNDDFDAGRVPYISAPGDIRQRLNDMLPTHDGSSDGRLRVALAWAGQPKHLNDRNRSLSLESLRPLMSVPDVEWFSLQKGDAAEAQLEPFNLVSDTNGQPAVTPLGPVLGNFVDTAHAVARMDLVISVDTSVAHLAGAMGVPTWLMVPFVPDWRWQLGRADSPWYPSVRLFRQPNAGNWSDVIARMTDALPEHRTTSMRITERRAA